GPEATCARPARGRPRLDAAAGPAPAPSADQTEPVGYPRLAGRPASPAGVVCATRAGGDIRKVGATFLLSTACVQRFPWSHSLIRDVRIGCPQVVHTLAHRFGRDINRLSRGLSTVDVCLRSRAFLP